MFGTRSGYVLTGDILDADQIKRSHKFQTSVVKLHRDAVTDMVVLPRSQRVVSCGLDGKIFGFAPGEDCERGSTQYVGHKRGVLSMAYSNGYEVFVSGGFEYFALCWAENLPRSPAFKLEDQVQPHQYPICSVLAVPRTPNVYTVDTSGVIKVFDVRTLKALGSWGAFDIGRVPTHVMHDVMLGEPSSEFSTSSQPDKLISSACYTGSKHRSIIVACRGVHRYMTESRNGDADRSLDLADPMIAVSIGTCSILTAGATIVRIWSIASGRITATHRTVRYSPSNVSSALVDDAGAKVITGHCDGLINVFQRDSGMLLRRYRFHDGKILYVKLDELHGVIFASCNRGQLSFWRDRDCASSSRGRYAHTSLLKPVEEMFTRRWTELPAEVNHEVVHRNDSIHPCALSRWTINRWCAFVQRQALARQGQGAPADVIRPIRTPNAFFNLFFPSRACSVSPQSFRIAVLSSKTVCRVIDYSVMPPKVTHSLFHGRDRPLISVGLHETKNICVVSDGHGAMFVWLLTQDCAATLLCSTFNKCLVSSYSHPHEEFREVDNEGEEQPQSEVRIDDGLQLASEMPPYKVPEDAFPTITSVFVDIVRFIIVTGDDVGFVSLWEIEPVFCGSCEAFVALQDSRASGLSPRWVHAWRAHPVPIIMAHTTTNSNYAVVTAAADNMVSLWTIAGDWLGGLRQGPVVDRTWIFPYPLMNRSSLVRYRFEKLFQAFASGELARLRRVRDKEELDRPVVHPDLTSRLFGWARHEGDVRSQIVEVVEPKEAVKRHVGFVMRKRVTTSLRTRTLSHTNFTVPPKNTILTEGPPPGQLPLEPHASSSDDEGHIVQFGNVVEEVSTLERNIWSRGKMHARLRRSDLDIPPLKLLPDMQLDIHSPTPAGSFQSRPLRRNPREVSGKVVSAVDPRPVVHRRASSAIPVLIRSTARAPHDESTNYLQGFLSLGGASVVSTHVSLTLSKVSDPASRSLTPANKRPTQETPAQQSSTNQRCSTATLRQLTPVPERHVRLGRPSSLPPFSLGRVVSK
ncbi:WD40 repeat-containing protein, putative [Bodo saltans]|uniref:WD40 repeat-containing protein, putative n=1 Tax=Bodo saltans TaxID=75058 RepID=A0A0S4J9G6_BODSA|nr:WD40 repeat-containing protein, putative [Bodo saltans]|eukprot:CUG87908.1 WD40 repeat-containing protein, putative [Bodo saltans]